MSQKDTDVRGALIQAAKTFLTEGDILLPLESIAWENKKFNSAEAGILWASVYYRPNPPTARTIGQCGIDRITGFLQIDLNVPVDSGEQVLIEWEDKMRLYFAAGNRFNLGDVSVLVISAGMGQGRLSNNNFRKSITISFRSDLPRQTTN